MKFKKCFITVLAFALVVIFSACGNKSGKKDTASVFNNDKFPSFVVENVEVDSGARDVVVNVKLKDNPGFLTMAMNIEYDSSAMVLTDVKNGLDYSQYNFIGPKNKISGCTASWFIPELPDKIVDGRLAELHFNVLDNAKSGDYKVRITRPKNGGVADYNKEVLVVNNAVGHIKIK